MSIIDSIKQFVGIEDNKSKSIYWVSKPIDEKDKYWNHRFFLFSDVQKGLRDNEYLIRLKGEVPAYPQYNPILEVKEMDYLDNDNINILDLLRKKGCLYAVYNKELNLIIATII